MSKKFQWQNLIAVGFEPTPPERLEPKSSALDHSATLPLLHLLIFAYTI